MKYLSGKDYPECCKMCQSAIDNALDLITLGLVGEDYIEDPEGPAMLAYDKRLSLIHI